MKVLLIAVLLAIAATVTVAGVLNDVSFLIATGVQETETEIKIRTDEYSEANGKDAEKEHGDSNESSSEEHDEDNEEKEQDEGNTKVVVQTCPSVTTNTPVAVSKPTHRPHIKPSSYVQPAYVKPTYVKPAYSPTNNTKPIYEQVAAPTYRPVVTTEAPKPTTVYNINYVKPEVPVPDEAPKYDKPSPTVIEGTTAKYVPISFEKPVATLAVTIRKSGWVRAPGYKLGYARAESSSNSAVITPLKYTPPVKTSEPVVTSTKTDEKSSASPQTYPKWFFKPKSTGN